MTVDPPPTTDPVALVDHTLWGLTSDADDPFGDRPADPSCEASGRRVEGDAFEVNTLLCPYLTATQPLKQAIPAGHEVELVIWHLVLVADMPAEAHVEVRIGEHVLFDKSIPIPNREAVYQKIWTAPEAIAEGTPMYFHLHNHGYNDWKLGRVLARPPDDG